MLELTRVQYIGGVVGKYLRRLKGNEKQVAGSSSYQHLFNVLIKDLKIKHESEFMTFFL